MQFNNGTDAIIADIDFLCDTSSTSYPLAAKTRNVNRWAYKAHIAQINGSNRWQVDDSNLGTLPFLTTTLVDGQADYTLPSGYLRIERAEIRNASGDYERLKLIDHRDVKGSIKEFETTNGVPRYYDLVGGSIILYPAPAAASVTTTEGMRLHILRTIDIFTTGDTTQTPGFPEPFQRICSYGASYDYLIARGDIQKAQAYRNEAEILLKDLTTFASDMAGDEHVRIIPAHRTMNYL